MRKRIDLERDHWSAIKDYVTEQESRVQNAELRLNQVRELLAQADDLTFEDFLDELRGILE